MFTKKTQTGIKPHTEATLIIDVLPKDLPPDAYLNLDFTLAKETLWAPAGHLVAFGQLQLTAPQHYKNWGGFSSPSLLLPSGQKPQVELIGRDLLAIRGSSGSEWAFDLRLGTLTSWTRPTRPGANLLTAPLAFDLYRALTDNDRGCEFGRDWLDRRLHQIKDHPVSTTYETGKDANEAGIVKIVSRARVAPPVLNWGLETETTFRFDGRAVSIRARAKTAGLLPPRTFSRFGLSLALAECERVRWFGRGPGESYRDKKLSQRMGNWEASVDDLFVDYEFPQDGGNRTDVRWVEFLGGKAGGPMNVGDEILLRADFGGSDGASFQALHYSTADLDESTHPFELHKRKREDTIVHLDWFHHGLGTGSCGPPTLPQYELKTDQEFEVGLVLE